jgi:hypothetical protein
MAPEPRLFRTQADLYDAMIVNKRPTRPCWCDECEAWQNHSGAQHRLAERLARRAEPRA